MRKPLCGIDGTGAHQFLAQKDGVPESLCDAALHVDQSRRGARLALEADQVVRGSARQFKRIAYGSKFAWYVKL